MYKTSLLHYSDGRRHCNEIIVDVFVMALFPFYTMCESQHSAKIHFVLQAVERILGPCGRKGISILESSSKLNFGANLHLYCIIDLRRLTFCN